MVQKTQGCLTAQVQVQTGKLSLLREIQALLPSSIKINKLTELTAPNNQNSIVYEITYGPVWGGWPSDIKSHFARAAQKVGTKATVTVDRCKRMVWATREDDGTVRYSAKAMLSLRMHEAAFKTA